MDDLLDSAAAGQVGHCPGGLLLGLEVSLDEDVDERLQTPGINDHLDLLMVSSSDVGNCPGTFLIKYIKLSKIFHWCQFVRNVASRHRN